MHIDKGANVQHCQSVWGQMSKHIIFQRGANVRGGTCPTLDISRHSSIKLPFATNVDYLEEVHNSIAIALIY